MHRYLFYATPHRMETDEYQIEENEDKDAVMVEAGDVDLDALERFEDHGGPSDNGVSVDMDPALADWFKVEPQDAPAAATNDGQDNDGSETEPDSDHDSLPPKEEEAEEEWLKVEANDELPNPEVLEEVGNYIKHLWQYLTWHGSRNPPFKMMYEWAKTIVRWNMTKI